MSSRKLSSLVALLCASLAVPAFAEGDVANGEKVFRKCKACHSVEPEGGSKVGPNLHDVVGRTSGTLADFKYSDAMLKLGEEGHIWTVEELDKFLEKPKDLVKGTKMTFVGLRKPEERADVIAYLVSLNPDGASAGAAGEDAAATEAEPAN